MSLEWHDEKRSTQLTSLVPVHEEKDAYNRNGISSSMEDHLGDFTGPSQPGDPKPALPFEAIDKALVSPTMTNRKRFNAVDMALKSPSIAKRKFEDVTSKISPRKGGRKATVDRRVNDMSTSQDVSPKHCEVSMQNQRHLISANLHLKRFFWKSAKMSYAKDGPGSDDRTPLDKLKHANDTVLKCVRTTMRIAKALDDVKECSEEHRAQRKLEEEQERIRSHEMAMEMQRHLQHAANLDAHPGSITEIDWLGSTGTRQLVEDSSEDRLEELHHLAPVLQRAMQAVMELCSIDLSYLDDIGSAAGSRFLSDMCTRLQASYQAAAKVIQKMQCRVKADGSDEKMCRALDDISTKLTKAVSCKLRGEKVDLSLFDGISRGLGLIMTVSKGGDDSQQVMNAKTRWTGARRMGNSECLGTREDAAKGRLSHLSSRSSMLSNSARRESHRGSTVSTGVEFCLFGTTHPEVIGAHKMPVTHQRKVSMDTHIGKRTSVGHHRSSRRELFHESETVTTHMSDGHYYFSSSAKIAPSYERRSIHTDHEPPPLIHYVPDASVGRRDHETYPLVAIVQEDVDPQSFENDDECPEYHPEQPTSEKRNPFRRRSTVVQAVVKAYEPEKKSKKQEGSPYSSSSSSQPDASRVAKFLWKQDNIKKSEVAMVEFSRCHATSPIKPKSIVIGSFEDEKLTPWSLVNSAFEDSLLQKGGLSIKPSSCSVMRGLKHQSLGRLRNGLGSQRQIFLDITSHMMLRIGHAGDVSRSRCGRGKLALAHALVV